jgi:hypothetical protein
MASPNENRPITIPIARWNTSPSAKVARRTQPRKTATQRKTSSTIVPQVSSATADAWDVPLLGRNQQARV